MNSLANSLLPFAHGIVDEYLSEYQYYLWEDPKCASYIQDKVDDVLLESLPRNDEIRLLAFQKDIMSIVKETPMKFLQSSLKQIMCRIFHPPFSVKAMKWLQSHLLLCVSLRTVYETLTMTYVQDASGYAYMLQFENNPILETDSILTALNKLNSTSTALSHCIQYDNLEWFLELNAPSNENNFELAMIHRSIRIVAHINNTLKQRVSLDYLLETRNAMPNIDAVKQLLPYNVSEITVEDIRFKCTREFMDICHLSTSEQIEICKKYADYVTLVDILRDVSPSYKLNLPTSIFLTMPLYLLQRLHKNRPDLFHFSMGKCPFQSVKCAIFCMQNGCRVGVMPYDCFYHQDPNFFNQCPIEWQYMKHPIPDNYVDWVIDNIPNNKLPDLISILVKQMDYARLLRLGVDFDYKVMLYEIRDVRTIVAEPKADVTTILHHAMRYGSRIHEILEECQKQKKTVRLNDSDLVHFQKLHPKDQDALCRVFTDQICSHFKDDRFRVYKLLKQLE